MDEFVGIDVSRKINPIWEAGLGYAVSKTIYPKMIGENGYVNNTTYLHRFDAIANFHFLPLMLNNTPERFDVYVVTRIGVRNLFTEFDKKADFFGGLGAAYYFTKNIGAYGEFGWQPLFKGNIYGVDLKHWRLGGPSGFSPPRRRIFCICLKTNASYPGWYEALVLQIFYLRGFYGQDVITTAIQVSGLQRRSPRCSPGRVLWAGDRCR